jgi:uncharacterized protein (TIGR03435 family)
LLLAGVWILGCIPLGFAQAGATADTAPAKLLEFDAVSVRQNKSDSHVFYNKTPKDGYAVEHYPLKAIVGDAYGIRLDLISGGPSWIETTYYDIEAKVAGDDLTAYRKLTKEQREAMVQAVLADRFKLAAHIETKELPGYELVVGKKGPKLKDSTRARESYGANFGDIQTDAMKIPTLAKILSQQLQRTVTDKTGLTGMYDFELKWTLDQGVAPRAGSEQPEASDPGPSLFSALEEQLGLKLNATKEPVETLVIDHVEQPSAN